MSPVVHPAGVLVHVTVTGDSGELHALTLAPGTTRFGRDPSNHVVLRNRFISAFQAELRVDAGGVVFHDLRSTNGSRIRRNRWIIEVDFSCDHEAVLQDGDELLLGDRTQPVQVRVTIAQPVACDVANASGPTIVQAVARDEVPAASRRLEHGSLVALSELSGSFQPREAPGATAGVLAAWILEHVPTASHVVVHLLDPATALLAPVASQARDGSTPPGAVSSTLRCQVLQTGKALMFVGDLSPSLHDASILEGICAPLAVGDDVFGLVQAERREGAAGGRFGRRDLDLVTVASKQASLALELGRMHASYRSTVETAIGGIIAVIESRDTYMAGHSRAVSELSRRLAVRMHLTEEVIERVARAGALHDIGRFGIPAEILNTPAGLTEEQMSRVRAEPEVGAGLLERFGFLADLVPIVRHVHERWDGAGYPGGLAGEDIPLGARIVAVADAFHTVVSHRAHRPAMTQAEALRALGKGAGTQFDPRIIGVLEDVVGGGIEAWEAHEATSIGWDVSKDLLDVLKS